MLKQCPQEIGLGLERNHHKLLYAISSRLVFIRHNYYYNMYYSIVIEFIKRVTAAFLNIFKGVGHAIVLKNTDSLVPKRAQLNFISSTGVQESTLEPLV